MVRSFFRAAESLIVSECRRGAVPAPKSALGGKLQIEFEQRNEFVPCFADVYLQVKTKASG